MLNGSTLPRGALALFLVAALACDESPTGVGPEPEIVVASLTLEAVGDAAQLQANVENSDDEPTWESLHPAIVTVSQDGQAVAVAAGTATVRARIGAVTAEGAVTVLPAVDIRLSELSLVTDPSGANGMRMRIRNLGGRGYYRLEFWRFTPDGRHERVLHYGSDTDAPVGLDIVHTNYLLDDPADWVLALAREPMAHGGIRTGCARFDGQPGCPSDEPEQPAPVDSVLVTPGAAVLDIGQTVQYSVRAWAGGVEVTDRAVTWTTITPGIISLSPTGLVRALSPGYGQVQADVEGVTAAVGLTVMTPEPAAVSIVSIVTPGRLPIRLWTGQTSQLQALVLGSRGEPVDGHTVTWAVQDTAVATIDSTGALKAVGPGTTAVSASAGGKTGYVTARIYVHPTDSASFTFFGTLSDSSAAMVQRSAYTTWTDSLGVEHAAFVIFGTGHLDLDWSGASPSYDQRVTMKTYIYEDSLQLVAEGEYVDSGEVTVYYDLYTGWHIYGFTSAVTPGLTYMGRYSLPGELSVLQPIGDLEPMSFYFKLAQ